MSEKLKEVIKAEKLDVVIDVSRNSITISKDYDGMSISNWTMNVDLEEAVKSFLVKYYALVTSVNVQQYNHLSGKDGE